jgi:hypothetical protein
VCTMSFCCVSAPLNIRQVMLMFLSRQSSSVLQSNFLRQDSHKIRDTSHIPFAY